MKHYVDNLAQQTEIQAALIYAVVMMPYAPAKIPVLLDMQDVDSAKWLEYAERRTPGFLYALEAKRLRKFERDAAQVSQCTVLTTKNEEAVLRSIAPGSTTAYMENGVDIDYFNGTSSPLPAGFENRQFIAFIGTLNYYPNAEAACWFAKQIFPEIRRRNPHLEFWVIGKHPTKAVRRLSSIDGVTVTGGVPDIRPFIAGARAVVAPLRLARGIQNKVIEALVMGRKVFASEAVCRTFGESVPRGIVLCSSAAEFVRHIDTECGVQHKSDPDIRRAACARFSWLQNLQSIGTELAQVAQHSRQRTKSASDKDL